MSKDIFKKDLKINWNILLKFLKFTFFLAILFGVLFLSWRAWLFWQDYQKGEILPPLTSKINKNKIEEKLKVVENLENYGALLKEKQGGRTNPFAPY